MKLFLVGLWAVCVTLGAGYAVAAYTLSDIADDDRPRLEGLRYTSLPTMSVPVIEDGKVVGYVVVRLVYTADSAVLRGLAAEPDAFITDEIFRALYGSAEAEFGKLKRIDLGELAETARSGVNSRLGDEVVVERVAPKIDGCQRAEDVVVRNAKGSTVEAIEDLRREASARATNYAHVVTVEHPQSSEVVVNATTYRCPTR